MLDATRARLAANPGLGRLLAAQIPADFADWLDFVAIGALLAFVWQAEPLAFAWLAVGMGLPYLTVGLVAGALVDRWPTARVLVASNLGRAAATAALILAPDWSMLVAIMFLRGCADSFYTPARLAAMQALTAPGDLLAVNGVSHVINQSSKIVAPALGGASVAVIAPQGVFAVNAGVSLLAALLLARLGPLLSAARAPDTAAATAGLWTELREGLALLGRTPVLRATVALMAAGFFAMFFYDTLVAPLIRALGQDARALGGVLAAVGLGGVIGGLSIGSEMGTGRAFGLIGTGAAISATVLAGIGLAEAADLHLPLWLLLAAFGTVGAASALTQVPTRAILQRHTDPGAMGRVTAISEAANMTALLIAPFIGALVAGATTVGAAFVLGGAVLAGVAVAAARLSRRFAAGPLT